MKFYKGRKRRFSPLTYGIRYDIVQENTNIRSYFERIREEAKRIAAV